MKKRAKWLAVALSLTLALSTTACGGGSKDSGSKEEGGKGGETAAAEEIKDLVTWEVSNREMENLFILNTEMFSVTQTKVFWKQMPKVNWFLVLLKNGEQKMVVLPGNSN